MLYNTILFDYCSSVLDSCGVGSKSYLDKLNRRAACIIKDRPISADEVKTTLGKTEKTEPPKQTLMYTAYEGTMKD